MSLIPVLSRLSIGSLFAGTAMFFVSTSAIGQDEQAPVDPPAIEQDEIGQAPDETAQDRPQQDATRLQDRNRQRNQDVNNQQQRTDSLRRQQETFQDGSQRNQDQQAGLGVSIVPNEGAQGVRVAMVHDGSPADEAGLKEGDIITRVSDNDVSQPQDVISAIGNMRPGQTVKIEVERNGQSQSVEATLESRQQALERQQERSRNQVFRFPSTPWNDDELSGHVRSLEQEIRRLSQEISELKAMLANRPGEFGTSQEFRSNQTEQYREGGAPRQPANNQQSPDFDSN